MKRSQLEMGAEIVENTFNTIRKNLGEAIRKRKRSEPAIIEDQDEDDAWTFVANLLPIQQKAMVSQATRAMQDNDLTGE